MDALAVAGLLFALCALVALGAHLNALELGRAPQRTCAQASPRPGRVKLSGTARAAEPLVSPLTQTPCIYYSLAIYRDDGSMENQGSLPRNRRNSAGELYASSRTWTHWRLEDETGSVEVDGEGAEVLGPLRRSASTSLVGGEEIERVLNEYRVPRGALISCHVDEELLPVDAPTFVCGRVVRTASGVRVAGEQLLVSGAPERVLVRRDRMIFVGAALGAGLALAFLVASGAQLLATGGAEQELEQPRAAPNPALDMKPLPRPP